MVAIGPKPLLPGEPVSGLMIRETEKTTSSATRGRPLVNRTSSRSLNVQTLASSFELHSVASIGRNSRSAPSQTRLS